MLTMMLERPWTDGATSRMELQRAAQRVSLVVRAWWSWEMQPSSPTHFPPAMPPPAVRLGRSLAAGRSTSCRGRESVHAPLDVERTMKTGGDREGRVDRASGVGEGSEDSGRLFEGGTTKRRRRAGG